MSRRLVVLAALALVLASIVILARLGFRPEPRGVEHHGSMDSTIPAGAPEEGGLRQPTVPLSSLEPSGEAFRTPGPRQGSESGSKPPWRAHPGAMRISGRVVDDQGRSVSEFSVLFRRADDGFEQGAEKDTFRSPDGSFHLDGLAAGRWRVGAARGPCSSAPVFVEGEVAVSDVVLVLPRAAWVSGLVVDRDGVGLPEAGLFWLDAWKDEPEPVRRTDAAGRFTFRVHPGAIRIRARHEGFSDGPWTPLELAPGERRSDLRLVLSRGGRVVGRLDPSVGVLADRQVTLVGEEDPWRTTRTDAAGGFAFEALRPQTCWIALEQLEGGAPAGGSDRRIRRSVIVREGQATEMG